MLQPGWTLRCRLASATFAENTLHKQSKNVSGEQRSCGQIKYIPFLNCCPLMILSEHIKLSVLYFELLLSLMTKIQSLIKVLCKTSENPFKGRTCTPHSSCRWMYKHAGLVLDSLSCQKVEIAQRIHSFGSMTVLIQRDVSRPEGWDQWTGQL